MVDEQAYLALGSNLFAGSVLAVISSAVALFATGWYEARITNGIWWRNGLQLAAIGIVGGLAGFAIGHALALG